MLYWNMRALIGILLILITLVLIVVFLIKLLILRIKFKLSHGEKCFHMEFHHKNNDEEK